MQCIKYYALHMAKSMSSSELISSIVERMAQHETTQTELAAACGLSQPHISKVLSSRVKLAPKTKRKFAQWLEATGSTAAPNPHEILHALATRIEALRPLKRMQIMEFLRAVERLLES
jgi:transcriptional regulator with XRE-family HTH domain